MGSAQVAFVAGAEGGVGESQGNQMSHKDQLKDLAMTANNGLTVYCAVHDSIFAEAGTVKSLFKNLIGRGVPMSELLENAEALEPLWDDICRNVKAFKKSYYLLLSRDERYFFDILERYVAALRETVGRLVDRQRLRNSGAKGGRSNQISWETAKQKGKHYQVAVQDYMAIGQELNAASSIVFDGETPETRTSSVLGNLSGDEMTLLVMTMHQLESPAHLESLSQIASEKGINFERLLALAQELEGVRPQPKFGRR